MRQFNRDSLPVFSAGGHYEQFWHGHRMTFFDCLTCFKKNLWLWENVITGKLLWQFHQRACYLYIQHLAVPSTCMLPLHPALSSSISVHATFTFSTQQFHQCACYLYIQHLAVPSTCMLPLHPALSSSINVHATFTSSTGRSVGFQLWNAIKQTKQQRLISRQSRVTFPAGILYGE